MFLFHHICLYTLVVLWLVGSSTAFDQSQDDVHHRHRALHRRRMEGRLMRRIPDRQRSTDVVVEKRVQKPSVGAAPGNIQEMTQFVNSLMQMNEDWQKQAMKELEQGKTPKDEESTASMLRKIAEENKANSDAYGSAPTSVKTKSNDDADTYGSDKGTKSDDDDDDDDDQDSPFSSVTNEPPPVKAPPPKPPAKAPSPPPKKVVPPPTPPKKAPSPPKQSAKKEDEDNDGSKKKTGSGGGGGGGGGTFHGDMTFFSTGLNACGWTDTDDQYIVAASEKLWNTFGHMSNGNPICGRKIRIHHNGKTVEARVTDQCPPCDMYSLDMSPSLFAHLENPDTGRCGVEWEWA